MSGGRLKTGSPVACRSCFGRTADAIDLCWKVEATERCCICITLLLRTAAGLGTPMLARRAAAPLFAMTIPYGLQHFLLAFF
ncbi:hypothetical protein FKM82_005354 [Ascaphus truei]